MRDNQDKRPEDDNVALPLTHRELLAVMNCLVIACESESTDATDKQITPTTGRAVLISLPRGRFEATQASGALGGHGSHGRGQEMGCQLVCAAGPARRRRAENDLFGCVVPAD